MIRSLKVTSGYFAATASHAGILARAGSALRQDYPYDPPLVRFRTPNGRFKALSPVLRGPEVAFTGQGRGLAIAPCFDLKLINSISGPADFCFLSRPALEKQVGRSDHDSYLSAAVAQGELGRFGELQFWQREGYPQEEGRNGRERQSEREREGETGSKREREEGAKVRGREGGKKQSCQVDTWLCRTQLDYHPEAVCQLLINRLVFLLPVVRRHYRPVLLKPWVATKRSIKSEPHLASCFCNGPFSSMLVAQPTIFVG